MLQLSMGLVSPLTIPGVTPPCYTSRVKGLLSDVVTSPQKADDSPTRNRGRAAASMGASFAGGDEPPLASTAATFAYDNAGCSFCAQKIFHWH